MKRLCQGESSDLTLDIMNTLVSQCLCMVFPPGLLWCYKDVFDRQVAAAEGRRDIKGRGKTERQD